MTRAESDQLNSKWNAISYRLGAQFGAIEVSWSLRNTRETPSNQVKHSNRYWLTIHDNNVSWIDRNDYLDRIRFLPSWSRRCTATGHRCSSRAYSRDRACTGRKIHLPSRDDTWHNNQRFNHPQMPLTDRSEIKDRGDTWWCLITIYRSWAWPSDN